MRYSVDHKAKTRQRIIDAAATVFRRKGFEGGSVDDVMREAGLTAGGFYAHFASKEQLFVQTLIETLKKGTVLSVAGDQPGSTERLHEIARKYLSNPHRKRVESGCPMPPLLSELARQDINARAAFQDIASEIINNLQSSLNAGKSGATPDQAWALLALLIGGISLSRAVADENLAEIGRAHV